MVPFFISMRMWKLKTFGMCFHGLIRLISTKNIKELQFHFQSPRNTCASSLRFLSRTILSQEPGPTWDKWAGFQNHMGSSLHCANISSKQIPAVIIPFNLLTTPLKRSSSHAAMLPAKKMCSTGLPKSSHRNDHMRSWRRNLCHPSHQEAQQDGCHGNDHARHEAVPQKAVHLVLFGGWLHAIANSWKVKAIQSRTTQVRVVTILWTYEFIWHYNS